MFIIKNNYYLYIDNINSINLDLLNRPNKFIIIYRNFFFSENIQKIIVFRKKCNRKKIKFYIANHYNLARKCKADGLYLSAHNKKIYHNINVIGSAHNYKEINQKIKQRCRVILLSRLFKTTYKNKKSFLGIPKFNLIIKNYKLELTPLGGIKSDNLLKLNFINSNSLAIMSEIKKKPAITSRLF
jgi:thiamine monophosphate synthase